MTSKIHDPKFVSKLLGGVPKGTLPKTPSLDAARDSRRYKGPGKPKTGFEGVPPSTKDAGPLAKPKPTGGEFKKNPPPRDITYKPPKAKSIFLGTN